jgi:hypothetical protein
MGPGATVPRNSDFVPVTTNGVVIGLRAERSGVRITVGTKDFTVFENVHTGPGAHTPSCTMGTGSLSRG